MAFRNFVLKSTRFSVFGARTGFAIFFIAGCAAYLKPIFGHFFVGVAAITSLSALLFGLTCVLIVSRTLRCPCCHEKFGVSELGIGPFMFEKSKAKYCPFCAFNLDKFAQQGAAADAKNGRG